MVLFKRILIMRPVNNSYFKNNGIRHVNLIYKAFFFLFNPLNFYMGQKGTWTVSIML